MKQYLNILLDAIEKKDIILTNIQNLVDEQERMLGDKEFSLADYNRLMEQKGKLIEDMNKLDDGFTAVYARISPRLRLDPKPYTEQMIELQRRVNAVSEKTALIQAKEMRIANLVDRMVKSTQPVSNHTISKSDVANKYAQVMKKNVVKPQSIFINKKN